MSIVTDTIMEEALLRLKGELDLKLNTTAYTSSLNTYPNIYCWGDSFTEGVGGYVMQPDGHNAYMAYSYPAWLGQNYKALNLGARNMGMNSLRAVQGADPIVIQTSFTIPASKDTPVKIGTSTQILDENNGVGFTSRAGNLVKINKQVETAGLNPCIINGVEGIIYREIDSNYISNEASYDYYFKRLESGEATVVPAQTEVQTYAMRNYRNGVGIFWIGANGGYTSNKDYVEKMESMIKYGDYLNYIIIAGTELSDTLIGMLKVKFTDNTGFCHVIVLAEQLPYRGYALAGISHQSVDTTGWTTTNVIKKAVPLLFEYISGQSGENSYGMHFSAWGYKAVAKLIEEKLGEMHLVCTNEVSEENKDQYGTLLYKSGKRVLDASTYVDTHVKLYDDASKNWTFVIKWHGQITSSSYPETIFCCMKDGSNKGLIYRYYTEGQYHLIVGSGGFAGYSDSQHNLYVKQNEENIIIIAKNGDNYDIYVNSPNKAYGATLSYGITAADEIELTCILGGRWNSSGTSVTIPTGFILDDCRIYDDALTSIDIQTLYNELKYPASEILATASGAGLMSASDKTKLDAFSAASTYAPIASPTFTTSITLGSRSENSSIGTNSVVMGSNSTSSGEGSLSHGVTNTASGPGTYAGGYYNTASSYGSHAEGVSNSAVGYSSHAEGNSTSASGTVAHAEGANTSASGNYSHAQGNGTIAASAAQFVSGKFNVTDTEDTYAEIIGNGVDTNTRKNIRVLDWNGNQKLKGDLYVGCNDDSSNGSKVATETYVTTAIGNAAPSAATQSAAGLMSSSDKVKLDTINLASNQILSSTSIRSIDDYILYFPDNRKEVLAFLPVKQVLLFKTTDGGQSWSQYSSDSIAMKQKLFSTYDAQITLPKINNQVTPDCGIRIIITGNNYDVPQGVTDGEAYGNYWNTAHLLNKERTTFLSSLKLILAGSDGQSNVANCLIKIFKQNFSNFVPDVDNIISTGTEIYINRNNSIGVKITDYKIIIEIYGYGEQTTTRRLNGIKGFGTFVEDTSIPLVLTGHLYSYDYSQNATFPAQVSATGFTGTNIAATNLTAVNNVLCQNSIFVNCDNSFANGKKLATEEYVDTAILNASLGGGGEGGGTISVMTGATSSTDGAIGLVPAPLSTDYGKFLSADGTWQAVGKPMVVLSYGTSTWQQFLDAYNNNVIVYCRASSNSDPSSGAQTRMAFMAYVNANPPTEVEFQYYRSVSSHTSSQYCDQVFIYKLNSEGTWSVTSRYAGLREIKVNNNSNMSISYSSNRATINGIALPAVTSSDNGKILQVVDGVWTAVTPS